MTQLHCKAHHSVFTYHISALEVFTRMTLYVAMLALVIVIATCLSVRHVPVLCQNEES